MLSHSFNGSQYIAQARRFEPSVPVALQEFIVGAYVQKRRAAHEAQSKKNGSYIYTQPRTLLAILRMSQALARLRFSDMVEENDVREALRLMDVSKSTLETEEEMRYVYVVSFRHFLTRAGTRTPPSLISPRLKSWHKNAERVNWSWTTFATAFV